MATRRRGVKNSHNKTRTTSKALFRKTRHKNKKNKTHRVKNNRTKKIYQRGGGPKTPNPANPAKTPKPPKQLLAKGTEGDKVEPKASRVYKRRNQGHPDIDERHVAYKKKHPTAEFDIPIEVSGLPFNVSVKSVKRKTPGQKSFTIMCGDARRFLTELGSGNVPYHMVIGIRQPHSTKPNKKEVVGCEIDLRDYKGVLFGDANDGQIKYIIDASHKLTEDYYRNSAEGKPSIDKFNQFLKKLNSKLQLAPKKENYDKKRDPRVQATFGFVPEDPTTTQYTTPFSFSSMDSSPVDVDGDGAGEAATATAMDMSTGQSAQSLAPVKTSRRRGISKKPEEKVEYFQKFNKPRLRRTSQLPAGQAEEGTIMTQSPPIFVPASFGQSGNIFSAIHPTHHSSEPPVDYEAYRSFTPISEVGFASSPAFPGDEYDE